MTGEGATSVELRERAMKIRQSLPMSNRPDEVHRMKKDIDLLERAATHIEYVEEQATAASNQAKAMLGEQDAEVRRLRVLLSAEVNSLISRSYTAEGVTQWWLRPRHQLDGRTPRQAFDAGDYDAVLSLAWGTIEQGAT